MADVPGGTEFRLVAACCRWPLAEAVVRDAANAVNWETALRLAMRHRVVPLVHGALLQMGIALPPAVADELGRRAELHGRRGDMQAAETVRLQRLFAEAGVASLALKGASLAQLAYGALDLKHARDIDLLVLPAQADAAWQLLERDAYVLSLPAPDLGPAQRRAVLRYGKDVELTHGPDLHVELQWRAAENAELLRGVDANAAAQEVALPQGTVRTLASRDLFAYLCVHGASHSWSRLKWLADLNALIAKKDEFELVALYRHAASIGAGLCAGQALLLCRRLLELKLPNELANELQADSRVRKLEALALSEMARPRAAEDRGITGVVREILTHFMLGRGWRFVAAQCRVTAISAGDAVRMPLPPVLAFLYPLMRLPLWLMRRLRRV